MRDRETDDVICGLFFYFLELEYGYCSARWEHVKQED